MKFEEIYHDKLLGSISGFDRIRFRGTIRSVCNVSGIIKFLSSARILLKCFMFHLQIMTANIMREAQKEHPQKAPFIWHSKKEDKDACAKNELAKRDPGYRGLICVFSTLECCVSPSVFGNKDTKKLDLKQNHTKCRHLYFYFQHPVYGFGHIRLQTWFPFAVTICINGRHWLENQLLNADIKYEKSENCFTKIENIQEAQKLLDQQLETNWQEMIEGLLKEYCPWLASAVQPLLPNYYWSADETEFATDYMFKNSKDLDRLFPMFARYAMMTSDSRAVMRFLGKKGGLQGCSKDFPEVTSDCSKRLEGMRVKHKHGKNSVKMYNKQKSVLRIETTINDTRAFKTLRQPDDDPSREEKLLPMRKGVADLRRRVEVSKAVNERYAEHIAATDTSERLGEVLDSVCKRATLPSKGSAAPVKVRALKPGDKGDMELLAFLGSGDWNITGFRNQDLVACLYAQPAKTDKEKKQRSARATRLIRILRAHGLVQKIVGENRYMVTKKAIKVSGAILVAQHVTIQELAEMAI